MIGTSSQSPNSASWIARLGNRGDELIASCLISVVSLALPLTLLQVYDRIIPNNSTGTIALLASAVAIAIFLELVLRQVRASLNAANATDNEQRSARLGFKRLLGADLAALENEGAGAHLERFNAISALRDFHAGQAAQAVQEVFFAAGFLVLIFILGGQLVFVPLATMGCMLIMSSVLGYLLARHHRQTGQLEDEHTSFLVAVVEGLFSAKALAVEQTLGRRYEALLERRSASQRRSDLLGLLMGDISAGLGQAGTAALVSVGSLLVIDGTLSMGGLAACTILAGRAMQPLQSALGFWGRFVSAADSRARTEELFEIPVQERDPAKVSSDSLSGRIEFKNVGYTYPGQSTPVLEHLNWVVEPGETVAITGPNGSGKSTMMLLVRGLLTPTSGVVELDGRDVSTIDPVVLSRQVALVTQREALFEGSILENLTLFRPQYDPRAYVVAEMLGFAEEISELPEGFGTEVIGSRIPRGLAQRIAIGRALVEAPRILLFDDAASAIDAPSDSALKNIFQSLAGKCTTIIVTHRPSIMQIASRVHDVREGDIETHGFGVEKLSA